MAKRKDRFEGCTLKLSEVGRKNSVKFKKGARAQSCLSSEDTRSFRIAQFVAQSLVCAI